MNNGRPTIVCATRGGAGSYVAQTAARRRAERSGARLLFIYVVTPLAYDVDTSLRPALRHELHWLGRVLVALAAQRARQVGLVADVDVREGELRGELVAAVRAHNATTLILGAPHAGTALLDGAAMERLARAIGQETGVETIVAWPDDPSPAALPAADLPPAAPMITAARLRPLAPIVPGEPPPAEDDDEPTYA